MPPFDVDPSSGQYQQDRTEHMRRPGYANGRSEQYDHRDAQHAHHHGGSAHQRMHDEAWQHPREFSRADEQRPQGGAENPYQNLQRAHDVMRSQGMESAEPYYVAAVQSADRIDPTALAQERQNNARQLQALEQETQSGKGGSDLQRRREALASRDRELYELYMSPGTARANMAMAYIRTGYDAYVQKGEQLLREALKLRPEMQADGNFQRHLQDAYRAGQGRTDKYQWGEPDGRPGGGNAPGDVRRPGDGGQGTGQPGNPGRPPG